MPGPLEDAARVVVHHPFVPYFQIQAPSLVKWNARPQEDAPACNCAEWAGHAGRAAVALSQIMSEIMMSDAYSNKPDAYKKPDAYSK